MARVCFLQWNRWLTAPSPRFIATVWSYAGLQPQDMASRIVLASEMGGHIKPEGWNNWRNPTNELTARYAEYNSTGPGANPDRRFKWTRQLTKDEAEKITIESVLGGSDNWNPAVQLQ